MNPPAVPSPASPTPTNHAVPPARRLLDPRAIRAALAAICTDSQREPETYLKCTLVPHGGE